ncbi:Nonribosomal peptide synthetase dtxS1 [Cladobotryum mycophilum]|uniref:Nonribosomal peptide synthetase dtxS1 n=1 Tax=Cladobotryum mycophilum TaxID=491253 RepID=A0ABR0S742_9HYPO
MVNTWKDQLEYEEQMDEQIQTPSRQIDLEQVEQLMRNHESVEDAAAVLRDGPDAEIVGFVTLHKHAVDSQVESLGKSGNEYETQQVQLWETVFDRGIYTSIDSVQTAAIGRDFTGWVSAYNGSPLDQGEMNEWLDDTIKTILSCHGSDSLNVLELGTGSGMILFSIAKSLRSYVGLELSQTAVDFVAAKARSISELANKVQVHQGSATDFHLLGSVSPDIVVINSVAQYFPSQDYLYEVVKGILQLGSAQTIFFGDIRSYALQGEFLVSKALHRMAGESSKEKIREEMAEMAQAELELLIDPAFFTNLPSQFPDLIEHVEILPKKMKANNELSCYRYAAVVHIRNPRQIGGLQQQEIHEVGDDEWIDFMDHKLDQEALLRRLEVSTPNIIAVSNIPYSKTVFERHIIDSLNDGAEDGDVSWLPSVRKKSQKCPALSALDLVTLSQQAGYQIEISWARQHSQRGGLDAIFHRYRPSSGGRVLFRFPTDHQGRPQSTFSNQPLLQQARQSIQQQLYETLQDQLPFHMVPEEILVLEKLPINANGDVDRQALAKRA